MKDLKLMMVFGWLQFLIILGSGYIAKSMPDDECQNMKMPVDIMPLKKKREIMKTILDYKKYIYIPQNYDLDFFL